MRLASSINMLATGIERIAGVFLGLITTVIFVSALARYLFASPLPDSYALSSLVLGVAVLWGLASVTWRDEHIAVDLVWIVSGRRVRQFMDVLSQVLVLVFAGLFGWMLLTRVETGFQRGDQTVDLGLPVWPFHLMAWLGVAAALVLGLARLYLLLFKPRMLPPRQVSAGAEQDTDKNG
jgi:TRAP-type C4-dicarboxylate transport system permease small subunit